MSVMKLHWREQKANHPEESNINERPGITGGGALVLNAFGLGALRPIYYAPCLAIISHRFLKTHNQTQSKKDYYTLGRRTPMNWIFVVSS